MKVDKTLLIIVLTCIALKFLNSIFTANVVSMLGTEPEANPIVRWLLNKSFHVGNVLPFTLFLAATFGMSCYIDYLHKNKRFGDYAYFRRGIILILTFVIFPVYVFVDLLHLHGHIFILPTIK